MKKIFNEPQVSFLEVDDINTLGGMATSGTGYTDENHKGGFAPGRVTGTMPVSPADRLE